MSSEATIQNIRRGIDSRIGLIFIRTANETQIWRMLAPTLVALMGHRVWEFQEESGLRTTKLDFKLGSCSLSPDNWDEWNRDYLAGASLAVGYFRNLPSEMEAEKDKPMGYLFCPAHRALWAKADTKPCGCAVPAKVGHRTLVMMGVHFLMEEPEFCRNLFEACQENEQCFNNLVVFVEPDTKIPEALARVSIIVDDKLPTREEITATWKKFCGHITTSPTRSLILKGLGDPWHQEVIDSVVDRLTGLSSPEVKNALTLASSAAVEPGVTEPEVVFLEYLARKKIDSIKKSAALESHKPTKLEDLGGLDRLKSWLQLRASTLTPAARKAGIPLPRGMLLLGVPGGGKSLCAKVVASIFDLPLFSLDFGALFGKYVGDSESNMRQALAVIEAAAPCVLMVN